MSFLTAATAAPWAGARNLAQQPPSGETSIASIEIILRQHVGDDGEAEPSAFAIGVDSIAAR